MSASCLLPVVARWRSVITVMSVSCLNHVLHVTDTTLGVNPKGSCVNTAKTARNYPFLF